MRALITGGAGFLASHICDALLSEGHSVVAVDNLLTGRMQNLEHLARESRFEFKQLDICHLFDLQRTFRVHSFAHLFIVGGARNLGDVFDRPAAESLRPSPYRPHLRPSPPLPPRSPNPSHGRPCAPYASPNFHLRGARLGMAHLVQSYSQKTPQR